MADRIRTVRPSGGNYSSLEGCLDGEAGDLVSAQERLWVQCAAMVDNTGVNQTSGWTTSATYPVYITADNSHNGVWSDQIYRLVEASTYAAFLTSGIQYLRTEGLQIANIRSSTTSDYSVIYGNTDHWHHRLLCLCHNPNTGDAIGLTATGTNYLVTASIIWVYGGTSSYPIYADQQTFGDTVTLQNCTLWGGRAAMRCSPASGGLTYFYNVHCSNQTDDIVYEDTGTLSSGSNYNLGELSTAPTNWGLNSYTSATVSLEDETWTTWISEMDLRRALGDDGDDVGTNLSAFFTTDVTGTLWATWDIGANESAPTYLILEQWENPDGNDDPKLAAYGTATTRDPNQATSGVSGAPASWGDECFLLETTVTGQTGGYRYFPPSEAESVSYFGIEFILDSHSFGSGDWSGIGMAYTAGYTNYPWTIDFIEVSGSIYCRVNILHDGSSHTWDHAVSLDTPYKVEVKWDLDTETWEYRWNGTSQQSGSITSTALGWPIGIFVFVGGGDAVQRSFYDNAYVTTDTYYSFSGGGTTHSASASISATGALSGVCNTVRFGRPSSDVSLGSWMTKDGGTSNIYLEIDESTYSDTDYILGTGTYETLLSSIAEPTDHTYHAVHYRYYKKGTSTVNLVVSLYDGTTEIASWTHNNIGASVVDATQYLNTTQASNITSYSNLRIRFSATVV